MTLNTNPSQRNYKADFDRLLKRISDNPNGEFINAWGITTSEKNKFILECNTLRPYRLYVFKKVVELLNKLGVTWFISDGTLLGWYRCHGSMIVHDYDIDVSILESDMQLVWRNRHRLPDDVVLENIGSGDGSGYVWVTDDENIPFNPSAQSSKKLAAYNTKIPPKLSQGESFIWEACVDIYTYRKETDGWHINYNMNGLNLSATAFPEDIFYPFLKTKFEGIDVCVPQKPKLWLELMYDFIGEDAIWDKATCKYKPRRLEEAKA